MFAVSVSILTQILARGAGISIDAGKAWETKWVTALTPVRESTEGSSCLGLKTVVSAVAPQFIQGINILNCEEAQ